MDGKHCKRANWIVFESLSLSYLYSWNLTLQLELLSPLSILLLLISAAAKCRVLPLCRCCDCIVRKCIFIQTLHASTRFDATQSIFLWLLFRICRHIVENEVECVRLHCENGIAGRVWGGTPMAGIRIAQNLLMHSRWFHEFVCTRRTAAHCTCGASACRQILFYLPVFHDSNEPDAESSQRNSNIFDDFFYFKKTC